MAKYQNESVGSGKEPPGKEKIHGGVDAKSEESCRCKEVSKKTPLEMLKFMIGDLAFWKKQKGKNPNPHNS